MASKTLAAQLLPLQISTRPSSQKQGFAVFSSLPTPSFPSARVSIGPHFLSSVLPRGAQSSPLIARSSSEEAEPAVGAEVATAEAEEETPADESADVEAEEKPPRKPIVKLGDIMGILDQRAREAAEEVRPVPDIRPGDVVEIKLEVPENRRRASTYKGIVISKQNAGIHTTIRIRRMIAGIGVEITFPVYSPNIKELKVVSHRKVRRAKLYYLKNKLPRLSTFK